MRAKFAAFVLGISPLSTMAGCSSPPAAPAPVVAPEDESAPKPAVAAETAFQSLEERMLAEGIELRFHITAEGAFSADLHGQLRVAEEIELTVDGDFGGQPHALRLWTQGDLLHGGPVDAPSFERPRPPALRPALLLGLTRMGLLHNLAVLIAGAPPDHADGGVQVWVVTVDHQRAEDGEGISFGLVVAGQPSGTATLWLDEDGAPRRREQTVTFPEGQMRVIERYELGSLAGSEPLPGGG